MNFGSNKKKVVIIAATLGILVILVIVTVCIWKYRTTMNEQYIYMQMTNLPFLKPIWQCDFPNYIKGTEDLFIYNPALIKYEGEYLIVARVSGHCKESMYERCKSYNLAPKISIEIDKKIKQFPEHQYRSASMLVSWKLNGKLQPSPLDMNFTQNQICDVENLGYEDPRLFIFRNELWGMCHYRGLLVDREDMCNSKIVIFKLSAPNDLIPLYYDQMKRIEKNWMPFSYDNELYVSYSIFPHTILHVDSVTGECTNVHDTISDKSNLLLKDVGGGAPPQKIMIDETPYFISIAHTRAGSPLLRKNFFYIFKYGPPFNIIRASSEFNCCKKFTIIEFASGIVVEDKTITISLGIDDCYSKIIKYDKNDVVKFLFQNVDDKNR